MSLLVSSHQVSEVKSVKMMGRTMYCISIILAGRGGAGGGVVRCGVEMVRIPYLLMNMDGFRSESCLVLVR